MSSPQNATTCLTRQVRIVITFILVRPYSVFREEPLETKLAASVVSGRCIVISVKWIISIETLHL